MASTLTAHSPDGWLEISSWSLQVILWVICPGWLEQPQARTAFHGPMPVLSH